MDIVKWRDLSKKLSGHPTLIRKNQIPKAHRPAIEELRTLIGFWEAKYVKKPEEGKTFNKDKE